MESARVLLFAAVALCAFVNSVGDVEEFYDDLGPSSYIRDSPHDVLGETTDVSAPKSADVDKAEPRPTWVGKKAKECKCAGGLEGPEMDQLGEEQLEFLQIAEAPAGAVESPEEFVAKATKFEKTLKPGLKDQKTPIKVIIEHSGLTMEPPSEAAAVEPSRPAPSTKGVTRELKEANDEEQKARVRQEVDSGINSDTRCMDFCQKLANMAVARVAVLKRKTEEAGDKIAAEEAEKQVEKDKQEIKDKEKRVTEDRQKLQTTSVNAAKSKQSKADVQLSKASVGESAANTNLQLVVNAVAKAVAKTKDAMKAVEKQKAVQDTEKKKFAAEAFAAAKVAAEQEKKEIAKSKSLVHSVEKLVGIKETQQAHAVQLTNQEIREKIVETTIKAEVKRAGNDLELAEEAKAIKVATATTLATQRNKLATDASKLLTDATRDKDEASMYARAEKSLHKDATNQHTRLQEEKEAARKISGQDIEKEEKEGEKVKGKEAVARRLDVEAKTKARHAKHVKAEEQQDKLIESRHQAKKAQHEEEDNILADAKAAVTQATTKVASSKDRVKDSKAKKVVIKAQQVVLDKEFLAAQRKQRTTKITLDKSEKEKKSANDSAKTAKDAADKARVASAAAVTDLKKALTRKALADGATDAGAKKKWAGVVKKAQAKVDQLANDIKSADKTEKEETSIAAQKTAKLSELKKTWVGEKAAEGALKSQKSQKVSALKELLDQIVANILAVKNAKQTLDDAVKKVANDKMTVKESAIARQQVIDDDKKVKKAKQSLASAQADAADARATANQAKSEATADAKSLADKKSNRRKSEATQAKARNLKMKAAGLKVAAAVSRKRLALAKEAKETSKARDAQERSNSRKKEYKAAQANVKRLTAKEIPERRRLFLANEKLKRQQLRIEDVRKQLRAKSEEIEQSKQKINDKKDQNEREKIAVLNNQDAKELAKTVRDYAGTADVADAAAAETKSGAQKARAAADNARSTYVAAESAAEAAQTLWRKTQASVRNFGVEAKSKAEKSKQAGIKAADAVTKIKAASDSLASEKEKAADLKARLTAQKAKVTAEKALEKATTEAKVTAEKALDAANKRLSKLRESLKALVKDEKASIKKAKTASAEHATEKSKEDSQRKKSQRAADRLTKVVAALAAAKVSLGDMNKGAMGDKAEADRSLKMARADGEDKQITNGKIKVANAVKQVNKFKLKVSELRTRKQEEEAKKKENKETLSVLAKAAKKALKKKAAYVAAKNTDVAEADADRAKKVSATIEKSAQETSKRGAEERLVQIATNLAKLKAKAAKLREAHRSKRATVAKVDTELETQKSRLEVQTNLEDSMLAGSVQATKNKGDATSKETRDSVEAMKLKKRKESLHGAVVTTQQKLTYKDQKAETAQAKLTVAKMDMIRANQVQTKKKNAQAVIDNLLAQTQAVTQTRVTELASAVEAQKALVGLARVKTSEASAAALKRRTDEEAAAVAQTTADDATEAQTAQLTQTQRETEEALKVQGKKDRMEILSLIIQEADKWNEELAIRQLALKDVQSGKKIKMAKRKTLRLKLKKDEQTLEEASSEIRKEHAKDLVKYDKSRIKAFSERIKMMIKREKSLETTITAARARQAKAQKEAQDAKEEEAAKCPTCGAEREMGKVRQAAHVSATKAFDDSQEKFKKFTLLVSNKKIVAERN